MKEYAKFLCKRILRRKSNIFLVLVSIFILGVVLALNVQMQSDIREKFESQIVTFEESIEQEKVKLTKASQDSIEYEMHNATIDFNTTFKDYYEQLLSFYDQEDWGSFYKTYQTVLKEETGILLNSVADSDDASFQESMEMNAKLDASFYGLMDVNAKQIAYITYLEERDLVYEHPDYPVFALNYITAISQTILPILVLICSIYVLAQLFTMDYFEQIDMSAMMPIGKKKKNLTKLLLGIGISIFIFLFMLLVIFLFSLCITSNTGFDYPLMIQEIGSKAWKAVSLVSVWKDWLIIGILFYISSSFATYLMSNRIKDEVPLFLSMLCIMIGLAYLPKQMSLIVPIAHYLPTTYLNFVKVISGNLANQYGNINLTFANAALVLSISILLQGFVVYLKTVRKQRTHF